MLRHRPIPTVACSGDDRELHARVDSLLELFKAQVAGSVVLLFGVVQLDAQRLMAVSEEQ